MTDILNIDFDKADEEACKMEHAISASTLDRFVDFMEFIQSCPRAGANWLDYFEEYRLHGKDGERCLEHMKEFASEFKDRIEIIEEMEDKNDGAHQG